MKIVIPGGSGQVGSLLAASFLEGGHEVVVLSRRPFPALWRVVAWDGVGPGAWEEELEGAAAVINLAGRSVDCRYTAQHRDEILRSRVDSTRAVGRAIQNRSRPPAVWLQASTATIYDHRYDAANDEATGRIGGSGSGAPSAWRFSLEVVRAWEAAVDEFATPATRKVKLRSALTLGPDRDGVFGVLLRLVRYGLGGPAGDGRQFVSWIHETDFVRAVSWLIERDTIAGAVNAAAPNPLPNQEFMAVLRDAWGRSFGLPAKPWMIELGAWLLRTGSELLLKSRRVVPGRLLADGFSFRYPMWPQAARELCERWRSVLE